MDSWKWGDEGSGEYTVKEGYAAIASEEGETALSDLSRRRFQQLWRSEAPWKQKLTAWRALWDRLPDRVNLGRRLQWGIEEMKCSRCSEALESVDHALLRCGKSGETWEAILNWVGVSWAAPNEVGKHFEAFCGLILGKRARKLMGGLWCCVIWVIWRWRNKVIFENCEWDRRRVDEEIKCRFWSWGMVNGRSDRNLNFLEWNRLTLGEVWIV